MELSIVVVNYNVKDFLRLCLRSVFQAVEGIEAEVFVVDNNSSDGSVAMVEAEFPDCRLLANSENTGFSVANNQAVALASGKYILLLNPDTVVAEDTFSLVIDFMAKHPDAGGVGVRMLDGSGQFLPESKRGFPSPWVSFAKISGLSYFFPKTKLFSEYHKGYLDEFEVNEVEVLSGAFMFMRQSVIEKVGCLDEDFFMYGEDIDLSYRITLGGYRNYYLPDTTIVHFKGESTVKDRVYINRFFNAMVLFAQKHFKKRDQRIVGVLIKFGILFARLLAMVSYLFRSSGKMPEVAMERFCYSGEEARLDEVLQQQLKSQGVGLVKRVPGFSNGVLLFPIEGMSFKNIIGLWGRGGKQVYYRFWDSTRAALIGSDDKKSKGVATKL